MNRRAKRAGTRLSLLGVSLVLGLTSFTRAQGPGPVPEPTPAAGVFVPNEEAYKSGLLTRYTPAPAVLPHDPDRDRWYNTRWGDYLPDPNHPNYMCNSGSVRSAHPAHLHRDLRPLLLRPSRSARPAASAASPCGSG